MAKEVVVLSLNAAAKHSVTKVQILCLHLLILLLQKNKKQKTFIHLVWVHKQDGTTNETSIW